MKIDLAQFKEATQELTNEGFIDFNFGSGNRLIIITRTRFERMMEKLNKVNKNERYRF